MKHFIRCVLFLILLSTPLHISAEPNYNIPNGESIESKAENEINENKAEIINVDRTINIEEELQEPIGTVFSEDRVQNESININDRNAEFNQENNTENAINSKEATAINKENENYRDEEMEKVEYDDTFVLTLKENLEKLGFIQWKSEPDGNFDTKVIQATEKFQKYYGLNESGKPDEATITKIEEILATPFQFGKNQSEIIQFKKYLEILGYVKWKNEPNGYFGSQTISAVKAFQKDYSLPESGILDPITLEKLEKLATGPLQIGMYRSDAILLKKNLEKLGFVKWKNEPNNYYGFSTARAIEKLQEYYKIPTTGKADEATLAKIEEILASPFQKGKRHDESITLKEYLTILGYSDFENPTNYYGSQTEKAIKAFQKDYGLPESGIAEPITKAKIEEMATKPLEEGMRRADAVEFKEKLERLGFVTWKNKPTNLYGSGTAKAVEMLQKYYGIPVTGKADEITLAKIEEILASPYQTGRNNNESKQLKKYLEMLGYAKWTKEPNGYYGSQTEKAVKAFQKDQGLPASGIADPYTLEKIVELSSQEPLKNGMRRSDAVELKKNLETLGFVKWKNEPNNYFGDNTIKALKKFQKYYGLYDTGVADVRTIAKIREILSSPMQKGKHHSAIIKLKKDLQKLGFAKWKKEPNDYYGSQTADAVKKLQGYYKLVVNGIADEVTLRKINNVLSSPLQIGKRHKDTIKLKRDLETLGYIYWKNKPTNFYGSSTERAVKAFQKNFGLPVSGIADEITLRKIKQAVNNVVKIFIDPGHGGKDPGALGYGLKEKNIVLDIGLKTAEYLRKKYVGVEVKLSRSSDQFVELLDRSKMANQWNADYFVSLHINYFSGKASGFETYIYSGKTTKIERQRQVDIHRYIAQRIDTNDRGMKKANFNVLRNTNMPAILLEYMFINNYSENYLLSKPQYRDYLAEITADAIAKSFKLKRR